MPHGLGCQRALCWQPYVCPSCDGAGANLTSLSTALLQPQLQYPMPKLSRFRPLLPHVAMLKKSETSSQASTPLWLLCMAQTFIVPLHRQKRGSCRDSKSMFSVWHSFHQPQTLSPLMCRNVCLCVPLPSILSSLPAMITYTVVLAFWVAKPNCLLLHTCFWIIVTTREKQGQHISVNVNTISQHSPRHCISDFRDF